MITEHLTSIEIRAVKNGFLRSRRNWVVPTANDYRREQLMANDHILVFETFDALVAWLNSHLKKPGNTL